MNMRDIRTSSPVNTLTGTNSQSLRVFSKGFCKIAPEIALEYAPKVCLQNHINTARPDNE